MTRRELLAAGAACASTLWARSHMDKTRISAITDEIGLTTDESIAFAHQFGMQFVEIRNPPKNESNGKKEYFTLTEAEIKADAVRFANEGLKVSFINTSLLKFGWPGSEPVRRRTEEPAAREKRLASEQARWDNRLEDLKKAIHCAQIMGCDKLRVFAGARVQDPKTMYSRIAETIGGEMAAVAEKEKVYLLIENEGSQNVATSAELADIFKLIPSKWVGMNWDPHNAYGKETSYPDGYALLPKKRILNVQVKGKGVMPASPEKEDWKAIMLALDKDGYKGKIGLETHLFDGTLIAAAHTSMEEIMRIVVEI
ncbi:MAG TPA: sugar phosphate isomerase/epimerase family protein [Bryobacteraceae bacterium]|jgi:sugar phosphate isomerase/epimerase|nr:sugar phosphate isomerase/epimerase family protein [Bryobacteraceae bacterium]